MKRSCIFLVVACCLISGVSAQITLDDLNVVFKHDFENNTPGDYLYNEWQRDFWEPGWSNRQSTTDIVQNTSDLINPTKALQMYYPAGTVGAENNGASWYTHFDKVNEIYVSYDIMFMPGFRYQLGGKIPSVQGGDNNPGVKSNGYNGFTGGLMFKEDGLMAFYMYFPDSKEPTYGETVYWGADYTRDVFSPSKMIVEYGSGTRSYCRPGEWHNITYRMVLNTVKDEGGGNYDGIMEAYFDGKMVTQLSHILFRHTENLGIDCIKLYTFFGGSSEEWKTPIDEWVRVDNVILYTFRDDINVPRGNVLSPTNRTINYWRNFLVAYTEIPVAPATFTATARTKSSITIQWPDNSANEHGFKIFRSLSANDGFVEIADVTANVTSYTDHSLSLGTNYFYKILAYNNVGNSDFAPLLSTSTLNLQLPAAPDGLTTSSMDYTSCVLVWQDKSGNETGFEIIRQGPDNMEVATVLKTGANITTYTDKDLKVNSTYFYRIRAFNNDGYSPYATSSVQITTPYIAPPSAPSSLNGTALTDSSVTLTWKDNSSNENIFQVIRTLVSDPAQQKFIEVKANDTLFVDNPLLPATSYQYTVRALNFGGNSPFSNRRVATTLSVAETKRFKEGLIAYYNFGFSPDFVLYDQSGFNNPVDLRVQNSSAVLWNKDNRLSLLSNTSVVSPVPAKKLTNAIKATNELSVECWIKPVEPTWQEQSRIISLDIDENETGFTLDQKLIEDGGGKSLSYSVRLQTESTNETGYPEFIPERTIPYINLIHVVYTRDKEGTETMYLNGRKSSEGYRPNNLSTWNDNFYLRFGNEKSSGHPWKGTYYSVAIYNRALTSEQVILNYAAKPCDSLTSAEIRYQIKTWPNPVSDMVWVEINPMDQVDISPKTVIRVVDVYGKILYERSIFNPNNQNILDIDCSRFPDGMYVLVLNSGDQYKTCKFVVRKPHE